MKIQEAIPKTGDVWRGTLLVIGVGLAEKGYQTLIAATDLSVSALGLVEIIVGILAIGISIRI